MSYEEARSYRHARSDWMYHIATGREDKTVFLNGVYTFLLSGLPRRFCRRQHHKENRAEWRKGLQEMYRRRANYRFIIDDPISLEP